MERAATARRQCPRQATWAIRPKRHTRPPGLRPERRYRQTGRQAIESGGGWLLADPKLMEYETGKVRFGAGSPAESLGIKAIDVSGAGCGTG